MAEKQVNPKQRVIGGLIWSFAERICAQLVTLIVGIVLARILSPDDYGIISIVTVFITLCEVFVNGGFSTAIVQKKEADKSDFNTAFYMSFGMSVILYLLLFFAAPYIAKFYEREILKNVIRVLSIKLVITSLNTIQQAYLQRLMKFRKFFIATIFGTVISCGVGIIMAYRGCGVWSLVAQYLTNTIVDTIILCFVCGWNPGLKVSRKKAKEIYSFGWKVLCTNLVPTIGNNLRSLLVGKKFGSEELAYYDQGRKYPALLVDNVNSTIQKVMLPTFSRMQDNKLELKNALRTSVRLEVYLLSPILVGFAAVAQTFVSVVLTSKWEAAIPFIWIFCANYFTRPIESSCHQALLAIGKNGVVFTMMVIIQITDLALMLIGVFVLKSVLWIAIFALISTAVSLICFLSSTYFFIGYKLKDQIQDIVSSLFLSLIMGSIVFGMNYIPINKVILLILQILCGIGIYVALSFIMKVKAFVYLKDELIIKFLSRIRVSKNHNNLVMDKMGNIEDSEKGEKDEDKS